MGIVLRQSLRNTISTYLGFGIGAINALFLYTNFLTDEYYGLVAYILSAANIMMPLMAFGVHNTIVKFYSSFKSKNALNSFLTLMLFLPLLIAIPVASIGYVAYDTIADLLSKENTIVRAYLWYIFITAISMAYFEVFFAWVKVQMKTVFGNFMKEVFHRVGAMLLLFSVYFKLISVDTFLIGIVAVYALRAFIMMLYAFAKWLPVFRFKRIDKLKSIINYALLIIIAGSVATLILDIDKFMLNNYLPIETIAYYSVAVFIATVIAVPQRAMHQILLPLTAKFLNDDNRIELKDLYQRSSLTLFIVSGLIFLLIVLNINELYKIIPEEFSGGLIVVFLISFAKLYDNLLGNNNAILFNSDYYRAVLVFGVGLAIMAIVLNMVLIPRLGINGSALATFIAIAVYNTVKIIYVHAKFKMLPFTIATLKTLCLLIVFVLIFYFWDFTFHPIVNILLKSVLIGLAYLLLVLRLRLSEDISSSVNAFFSKSSE
ncbi:lipopolysaccharide biosynthesis protein [Psychroserpens sp.]|uniref:lipopolysaccharide biosynthesis protein n=1 Tax=Psychroserpens sp. TaxID=2020870 RepID=UPI001B19DD0B|nr:polysaccharide biosynthesis C-terminal domain-containing protein [Psychroserpens sp.]MBO6606570.1 oligosaccharide flippase family protein [Psychroserpens sp.]MBO6631866.1 oligosaccharide flippase family protein [Psychroserpens sp.]MBO6653274.1 oligosaccharide flippase family protein [Psychroserpens sp.]MBO6680699.1 oligosaccharide flippase family protein [Psychroserpens sp.]MBO6750343.1 oligosaccharide flippase family protein [Psychroserpens sp.]